MLSLLVNGTKMAMLVAAAHHPAAAAPAVVHDTVDNGDTLSSIASTDCGTTQDWTGIYKHNKAIIGGNPDLIIPGQRLKVVCKSVKLDQTAAAPVHTTGHVSKSGKVWGVTYGYPYFCGDGDGDGYDMPCSELHHSSPAAVPVHHAAPVQHVVSYSGSGGFQSCVISRESGGNPRAVNASSGAGGLYQFLPSTWEALGHSGLPENASVAEQNQAFAQEYAQSGTSAWGPYDGC